MSKSVDSPVWPWRDQVLEAPVRVLGGAEAGDLAHRPEPAAVHRRVRAARVRDTGRAGRCRRAACRRRRAACRRASAASRPACGTRACALRLRARETTRPRSSPTRRPARRAHARSASRCVVHRSILLPQSFEQAHAPPRADSALRSSSSASSPATWPSRCRANGSRKTSSLASSSRRSLISARRAAMSPLASSAARWRVDRLAQRHDAFAATAHWSPAPAAASRRSVATADPAPASSSGRPPSCPHRAGRTC